MKLNQKIIDAASKLMETITKGYQWYTDTPEQPFEYTSGSIWLLNPDTKEWMLLLEKSGELWYFYKTHDSFSKYLNMERYDFELFITIWVEDVLKRGVVTTGIHNMFSTKLVEDVLKRGVVTTDAGGVCDFEEVKDVLKNGKQWN